MEDRKQEEDSEDGDANLFSMLQLEAKKLNEMNALTSTENHVLFMGECNAGKTTLINIFLSKKDSKIIQTMGLDYNFAKRRRSKGEEGSIIEGVSIWEMGGSTYHPDLAAVPLRDKVSTSIAVIVLDLSKPANVVPSLKKWLYIMYNIFQSDSTGAGDIPLLIVGNKYDIFKHEESVKRKVVVSSLRNLALLRGASLVFASKKDQTARDNFKTMSRQRLFSPMRGQDYWTVYGKLIKNYTRHDGPIIIYPGYDSQQDIITSMSSKISKKITIQDFQRHVTENIKIWIKVTRDILGPDDVVSFNNNDKVERMEKDLEKYPNENIDTAMKMAKRSLEDVRLGHQRYLEALRVLSIDNLDPLQE